MSTSKPSQDLDRQQGDGFSSLRLIAIAFPLIVVGAFVTTAFYGALRGGDLSGGAPPTGAFVLFLPILAICALVPAVRRRWARARGQLVVLFSMLFLGVSLAGSGFWFHFVPSQIEFHRSRDLDWVMNVSPDIWPNDGNVLEGRSAEDEEATGAWSTSNPDTTSVVQCPDTLASGPDRCVRIEHTDAASRSRLDLQLVADAPGPFVRPLHRYAVSARIRLDEPGPSPLVTLRAGMAPDQLMEIGSVRTATAPNMRAPDRFAVVGLIDYKVPRNLGDRFNLSLEFTGRGVLYVRDFSIISTEEVYRFFEGYKDATPQVHATLPETEAALVRVRPANRWSLAYAKHLLFGQVPWRSWSRPLMIWGLFVAATFLALFCLVTILFRHWDEGERLTFPLENLVLELTAADGGGRLSIIRCPPFWIALIACSLHLSLQQLHDYFPQVPHLNLDISLDQLLPEGRSRDALASHWGNPAFTFSIQPLYVAVAFFISIELSTSIVFFHLASWVYRFIFFFTPLKVIKTSSPQHFPGFPFSWLMASGGLLFMACFTIFSARKHLVHVARQVYLFGHRAKDNAEEAASYRLAVLGLLVATVLYIGFARGAQISVGFILIYMAIMVAVALGLARIRAETGLPTTALMVSWPQAFIAGLGSSLMLGYRQITFTAEACFLYAGSFLMLAPILAEAMAGAVRTGVPLRKVKSCLGAAFLIAIVAGGIVTMSWTYTAGVMNMNTGGNMASKRSVYNRMTTLVRGDDDLVAQHFGTNPDEPRIITDAKARQIAKIQPVALVVTGVSFAITGLLALARVVWLGFPLHPLGFALAFSEPMGDLWASIAVAALVKYLGLRFGGVQFNRRVLRPLFVGLFVSALLMDGLWIVVRGIVNEATGLDVGL